jgi:hypothetical protein
MRKKFEKAADWLDAKLKKAISYLNIIRQILKLWDYLVAKVKGLFAKIAK